MKKRLLSIPILLLFTLGLASPTGPVAADGSATRIEITATSYDLCQAEGHPLCWTLPTEFITLPNGKMMIREWLSMMKFTSTDDRWNAICYAYSDILPPATKYSRTVSTHFVCTPDAYDGYWEGTVVTRFGPEVTDGVWSARGYGDLDGLLSIAKTGPSYGMNQITIIDTGSN